MGRGAYNHSTATARTAARKALPAQEVFTENRLHPGLSPSGLVVRESRDSEAHQKSIGAVLFTDITGSMGDIPHTLATVTLPDFLHGLSLVNSDAQVLFAAFGDAEDGDLGGALQFGQFETDDRLADECLTRIWLGGSGGSWGYESADLAFYTMGFHTSMDCWVRRKQKGCGFVITDDTCRPRVRAATVNRLFGRNVLDQDLPVEMVIAKAAETFHLFVLIPDHSRARQPASYPDDGPTFTARMTVQEHWKARLRSHGTVVVLDRAEDAAIVANVLFGLTQKFFQTLTDIRKYLSANFRRSGAEAERVISSIRDYARSIGVV